MNCSICDLSISHAHQGNTKKFQKPTEQNYPLTKDYTKKHKFKPSRIHSQTCSACSAIEDASSAHFIEENVEGGEYMTEKQMLKRVIKELQIDKDYILAGGYDNDISKLVYYEKLAIITGYLAKFNAWLRKLQSQ